jgi:mono/diheme cytochrome c family protein
LDESTPQELAQWLASLGKGTYPAEDEDLADPDTPAHAARVWTGHKRRDWKVRTRDWLRRRPLFPIWLFVLLSLPFGSMGCSRAESSTWPQSVRTVDSPTVDHAPLLPLLVADQAAVNTAEAGTRLYERLCSSCHGQTGDGAGPAARFLYPRPRNFRQEQFRMVSTTNLVPSDADLMRTLERGMPGSSMFSFGHLSTDNRKALVAHVRGLVRQGLEDRLKRDAIENGEEPDLAEIAELIGERTQAGPSLEFPAEWPAEDAASIARGRELYVKATCASCHGETGRGDGVQEQKDELGMPIRPRDYTRGVFKGGREREPLYARIALGVPGTPMPSSPALQPGEIADLVHYIRSLSDPATELRVVHKRSTIRAQRSDRPLPESIPDEAWEKAAATQLVVSPLWWRDDSDADLKVRALHDGRDFAIQLSWNDPTNNGQAIRTEEFPDLAAVQLFRGRDEPFLGMGAKDAPVEVWLWNAATQADLNQYADVDTTYPNMVVDSYQFATAGDGPRPHATNRQPKDFLTAWAAGNQRSDPTRLLPGSALAAEGMGSTTLRPPVAQDVKARGSWRDGRWTVVLRRTVADPSDVKVSIAFALWDGASRDRNGQKLVSIWHDLERP